MKSYCGYNILAFLTGIISALYVSSPVGFVAMLDMGAYIAGPLIFLQNYSRYSKHFRILLAFIILWIINAIISDIWRGTPLSVAFKAEMILVNSFTLAVLGEWMMRKSPYALPLFLSGAAISGVISLYYFQNGALLWFAAMSGYYGQSGGIAEFLSDKQVKPLYASCILMTIVMGGRYLKLLPWIMCIIITIGLGVYMLVSGGARSVFLIYLGTGMIMALYAYMPGFLRLLSLHKLSMVILIGIAAVILNFLYGVTARNGLLGEEGYRHYEDKVSGNSSFLDNRSDLLINWPFLWRSPVIGAGTELRDKWGYVNESPYVQHYTPSGLYINHQRLYGHSCIVGAWTANGIFGLIFWLYVLWLMADCLGGKIEIFGDLAPFVIFVIVNMFWDILFSPYGGFRGKAMFMAAFLSLTQNNQFMYWMTRNMGKHVSSERLCRIWRR